MVWKYIYMKVYWTGFLLTLKLMDKIFDRFSICGCVGHLHFPRPRHHKICGFVL